MATRAGPPKIPGGGAAPPPSAGPAGCMPWTAWTQQNYRGGRPSGPGRPGWPGRPGGPVRGAHAACLVYCEPLRLMVCLDPRRSKGAVQNRG
eukprot:gene19690-biopygen2517